MTAVAARDRWLFLTPEVEAQLPAAVAALRAALDEPGPGELEEADLVERIILGGGYAEWLAYLAERRELLERYVNRIGPDALAALVAQVLNEQHMLSLTVPGGGAAEPERVRAGELLRRTSGPDAR
ncbi:MAG: hypothetical protein ACTHNU_11845 [Gaiellales bacterium]